MAVYGGEKQRLTVAAPTKSPFISSLHLWLDPVAACNIGLQQWLETVA
eukprot:CAMPEP_0194284938 /NCGR_PEP_ID=MMETSP0169-20130528/28959_1 /TAXON_ID=218684 /ORGANISM="Corethron pennatum, Strain L29A3" /LENGTH=47 /DNA_ID= /DNA_START= /DNA_END= /DNA_ORIENTATION=